jgi:hypothetical protein
MSLAKLFYLKETFRERVRRWRQACFRYQSTSHVSRRSSLDRPDVSRFTSHASRFLLEALEPRVLLSATPTEVVATQALEPAAITVPAGSLPSLDVDLNGQADALSDGILIIRHLFGFTGTALTDGVVDPAGQRTDPTAIQNYLTSISGALDVDLNQSADALSDGIMIIRSLFGFAGTALTSGAIDPAGQRTDSAVIATFLDNMNPQRELLAPLMTAGLQQDTGISTTDTITFNPTITGTIADINQIVTFTAGFDATPVGSFVDVLTDLLPTGAFTISSARLNQLAGGTLADGAHTLHLRATDARGNVATIDRTLTLDTAAPLTPIFDLSLTSDTDTLGDQQTTAGIVTLKGLTDPTTPIQLVGPGTSTLSSGTGTFQLPDLTLAVGDNAFTLRASDVAGNTSDFNRVITRLAAPAQVDVVLTWNQTMLEAIRLDATPPPIASRGMAMVSLAMYDTINAIEGTPGYYVSLPAQAGTNADAAAASAAHRVLSYLYPGQQAFLDSQLAASLASIPDGAAKTNGITLGQSIADAIIAIRATDGWNDFVDYVPGTQPGDWQQTAPMYDVALLPQWADLTPFALTSPTQFTPAGPPALTSQAYADAFNEVKALGSATGSTRTPDQTQIARFWADGAGTFTPPGHWNQIAEQIALQQGNSLSANARLFAELNVALADAGITAWNTKYADAFWRPVTAIQQADLDGNALTIQDPTWTSLLITPPFPEYVSGHSTFSGAAAEILTSLFGANVAFTTESLGLPGVQRSFTSFEQAAQEAGKSRIYGGIHFEFSNQDGLTAGKALADFVLNRFTVTTDTQGPKILLTQQTGTVTKTNLTLTGQVLDNLSGVASLQAKLDSGAFAPVTFSSLGTFSLPTTLVLDGTADGIHTLTFQATDNQANSSTVFFNFTLDTKAPVIALTNPLDNATLTATTRLTGAADATGSKLVELCYKFDNGTLVPVSFDPAMGSFNATLDLSKLVVGAHTLSLRAQDQAGNVTTITRNVSLAAPIPLTIIEVTPQQGLKNVGATFRPQVFFSLPINPGSLTNNNFFATDSTGTKLAATIVPSQDGTFAWLFFTNPMPGGETITLHVDGTSILAAGDGQPLDADGNGTPGGIFTSTFSTVSLVPLLGTTLSGKVLDPGPDLKLMTFDDIRVGSDGVLHTSDDVFLNPIAGAKVFIVGLENQAVFTDAQGNFSFSAVPSGDIKLAIDGRTATNAPAGMYFPEMVMDLQIEVGQPNTVMGTMGTREAKAANLTRPEVYLPRLRTDILQNVSDTQTTMVGVNATAAPNLTDQQRQYLTLEVQPGSLIGPDGQVLTGSAAQVGISTVPPELVRDMLPPGLLQHTFDITIQAPDAAAFTTPLQMTFPNVFNAAPGTKLNFLSFDHTTGRLVVEGTATVSADGLSVTTDPDTGITKPGWHGVTPPTTPGDHDQPRVNSNPPTGGGGSSGGGSNGPGGGPGAPSGGGGGIGGGVPYIPIPPMSDVGVSYFVCLRLTALGTVLNLRSATDGSFYFQNLPPNRPYELTVYNPDSGLVWNTSGTTAPTGQATVFGTPNFVPSAALDLNINGVPDDIDCAMGQGRFLDFGTDISPVAIGYQGVTNSTAYSAAQGYGWLTGTIMAVDRSSVADVGALRRDFNALTLGEFGVDVTPGVYDVTVTLGDALAPHEVMKVSMEGELRANISTQAGKFYATSYRIVVTDGRVNVAFDGSGGTDPLIVVNAIDVVRIGDVPGGVTGPVTVTTSGGLHYFVLENLDTGFLMRGQQVISPSSPFLCPEGVLLAPNTRYRQHVFSVETLQVAYSEFTTPSSGTPFDMPVIVLARSIALDGDLDGLTDDAEFIVGTNANTNDTDGDGIRDLAEVQQGLDPLGGLAFPTGVIATVSLRGEAKEVVLEGALANPDQLTAYVATGSYGLAIVDVTQFQRPVVLSQLDLAGDATDVSVESLLGIAVVAANAGGLHFVDVSNQVSPTLIRTIATTPNQVKVFDGFAYVTVGGDLRSYNLLTGELVQSVSVSTAALVGLAREGNMFYTTDTANVLRAVSVSAGALTPRGSMTLPIAAGQSQKIFVGNGIAYIGAEIGFNGGFATADVSSPDALVLLSGIDGVGIAGKRIVANGSGLGVSVGRPGGAGGPSVLDVVSLTDPTNTNSFLTRFTLPTDPFSVAIGAGIAFVADGTGGLQVVNYRAFDNQSAAPTVSITSPVNDVDPVSPGIQLTEGSAIPIRVNATDDVQVRNVEMLVNGVVVINDVSFPFEVSALAVGSTLSATSMTVQVRATDTGGNVALSNTLTFSLVSDTFPPALLSSNVTNGAIKDRTFRTIQLQFSEALDPATVTAQNFELRNPLGTAVAPTAIQLLGGGSVVQLTYDPLDLGVNQFVIASANVTDLVGNALGSQNVVIPFEIFSNVVLPLFPLPPLGSGMYWQAVNGQINAPLASESFTISLDGGQLVTIGVSPASASLRPRIEVLDSTGAVLGAAESQEIGGGVALQGVSIPIAGLYTVRVQSLAGTGSFRGGLLLNLVEETEFYGGPPNNTLATAMDLSLSSIPLQGAADRMGVLGVADGGNDFYRVELTQGQVMFASLYALAGGSIALDMRDSAGTVLSLGQDIPGGKGIFAFQAPTTGSYYLNVTGLPDADPVTGVPQYSLVVTRGAAVEYLPNDTLATAQVIALTGQAVGSVGTRVFPQGGVTVPDSADFYAVLANAGDILTITTTTPGDGIGEPTNTLDPLLQLFDPTGALIATNLDGAPDGRNAVITATAATAGLYKIGVLPTAGGGDYTVRVTGATGQPTFNFQVDSSALGTNASQATATLHFTIPPLLSSVSPGDVTVNGIAASSLDVVDAQTLRFNVSGVTPVGGGYTVNLASGMIQDLHGNANPAFSRLFTSDTTAPVVTASSINAMTVLVPDAPGTFTPLTVTFTFSEAIDQTTLTTDDVQFRTGIAGDEFDSNVINAASVTYNATLNQLTAVFNWGRDNLNTLTLVSGTTGIHDLAGNPLNGSPNFPLPSGQGNPASDNYVVEFGVGPATPTFTPFEGDSPIGSLLYSPDQDLVSTFSAPGETDVWTLDLDAGQILAIGFTPTMNIQGQLSIVDPNGLILGTISSATAGQSIALADIPVAMAGTYRIEVTSLEGIGAYSVGGPLGAAVDTDHPRILTGTNNTVATAQPIGASVIPLQGTASRLAVIGHISSTFDADLYLFQLTAGQPATLVLKMFDVTEAPVLELLTPDGSLLVTGGIGVDGTIRIADFVPAQTGTYLARVASGGGGGEYNLIVTRGTSFEQPGTEFVPQDISVSGQVLGGLEQQGHGANGAIRVAVLGVGATPLVSQLNDDTFYDFEAVAVTATDIDTFQKLNAYDVVVIGDPTSRAELQGTVEQALQNWWFSRGGGLVGTGGLVTAAGPAGGFTLFGLDNVIPINLNALSTQVTNPTLTINSTLHEVTQGQSSFTVNGNVELPTGTVDQNAVLLGTVNGAPSVVAHDLWDNGEGPRSAFVGPMYFDAAATGLRSGSADRLLEQTIAWASHVDTSDSYRVNANVGDQLVIKTTTPLDGPKLPQNVLDPRIELLNPAGTLVASNDNGAADGKNALLNFTVPIGGAGTYTIRVKGLGAGEYTVAVTGATGIASASTTGTATLTADVSLSATSTSSSPFDGSLAYVQQSWVKDFVATTDVGTLNDEEELLISLPVGG